METSGGGGCPQLPPPFSWALSLFPEIRGCSLSFRFQTWVSSLTQWKKKNGRKRGRAVSPTPLLAALSPQARAPPVGGSAFGLLQFKQHVPPALRAAAAAAPVAQP